jgi:hypothetical protein
MFTNDDVLSIESVGDYREVMKLLGVAQLTRKNLTGRGVRIAIVDTGIHGAHLGPDGKPLQKRIDSKHCYSPIPDYKPGSNKADHATMVAYDCSLAAGGPGCNSAGLRTLAIDYWILEWFSVGRTRRFWRLDGSSAAHTWTVGG